MKLASKPSKSTSTPTGRRAVRSSKEHPNSPIAEEERVSPATLTPALLEELEAKARAHPQNAHPWENDPFETLQKERTKAKPAASRSAAPSSPATAIAEEALLQAAGLTAAAKALATWKTANTLLKALAKRASYRWQFFDFLGPNGRESAGVVDVIAMRKSSAKPNLAPLQAYDLFDIILIQSKGGSAKSPSSLDIARLRAVKDVYRAQAIVLFEWRLKTHSRFHVLDEVSDTWTPTSAAKLFGL